jgi:hypothetical protein
MLHGNTRQIATEMANPVFAAFRPGALLLIAAAACGHVCAAHAPPVALGAITGVITDAAHVPLASATVTAVTADGREIRATVTNSAGLYAFADLPAGSWSLTFAVPGYPDVALPPLEVNARKATRRDVVIPGTAQLAAAAAPGAVPEALQAPEPGPAVDTQTPFAVGDLGWMNGTTRGAGPVFDTKFFTPEVRFDASYLQDFNHPVDHTITGSTEELRSGEFQIDQVGLGGNFHWQGVQARFLSMFGLYASSTQRNDASTAVGQWDLSGAYKYMSEANAGYHWDVNHGLNVDAGLFVSYIGLYSYYNFDNWTYQPSFLSAATPWYFNGVRVQWFPTQTLKIEPWLINGWEAYAKFNSHPGLGGQILWIPNDSFKLVSNTYAIGEDNLASFSGVPNNGGNPNAAIGLPNPHAPYVNYARVQRVHEDDSVVVRYYDNHGAGGLAVSKMAFSVTADLGCEYGGGVECAHGPNKANVFGMMGYDRTWFDHDLYAVTFGGGFMNNPGRYLAPIPPVNGATAATDTPYFTENPGQKLYQWDLQLNFQYMPKDWITWWTEATLRHSDVPYFSGPGGVTPPAGNNGSPASFLCNNSSTISADNCAAEGGIWYPDLRTREVVWGAGVLVKF